MWKLLIIVAKSALALLSAAGVGLLMFAVWLVWHYEYGIGLPDDVKLATVSATGPICSAGDRRTYLPLAEIPPLVRRAVIAYEEPDFYERPSVNPWTEPVLAALFNRSLRRANISVSVTRCLTSLSPGCCQGIDWHIGNAVLMNRVERNLSRDNILEIYLNESYFGRGTYGVAAAAMSYFGKPLGLLSIDQIAFIAALPRAPTLLSRRKDIAVDRRNLVIERMLQYGAVNEAQAAFAKERPLEFRDEPSNGPSGQQKL